MPKYKFTYSVETPLRATEDVTLTHGTFSVDLGFSRPIDVEHIPACTVAEGANWMEANAVAMEDGFGPVLDALSLHRKAPAMVQDLISVVKAETGNGFFQTNLHHFVEFATAPGAGEFAEIPPVPDFEGQH